MAYDLLFSPIIINGMKLDNRIVMAPVRETLASADGFVTEAFTDYYLERARGGASMIVIGAVAVAPKLIPLNVMISDDKFIPGLKDFMRRIHEESRTKVSAQLFQIMKTARGWIQDVHDVTAEQITRTIQSFEQGARRARDAGFDAIEFHAAHGYVLAEFLSFKNKRRDGYGGNTDARLRLISEILERVRQVVGPDYPVGIRINGDDFIVGGTTLRQSTVMAVRLAQMGFDYISVSAGGKYKDSPGTTPSGVPFNYPPVCGYSGFRAMPPAYMPDGVNVYLAAAIKDSLVQAKLPEVPVMTAGRIPMPELAEAILASGKADLIGLCRPLMRDPEWPKKAREGRVKEIKRCAYCNQCLENIRTDKPAYCKHLESDSEKIR